MEKNKRAPQFREALMTINKRFFMPLARAIAKFFSKAA